MSDLNKEVVDLYYEHSQHKNEIKGFMKKYCSECFTEHQVIMQRINRSKSANDDRTEEALKSYKPKDPRN